MHAPIGLLLVACGPRADPLGVASVLVVQGDPVPKQDRPLAGGRAASGGGAFDVFASDEDGDRIVVQDLDSPEERHLEIRLPSGWAPGAISMYSDTLAAVLAQGAGRIVIFQTFPEFKVDLVAPVCADPRDIYWGNGATTMWVACGDGNLVEVSYFGGEIERTWFVAPDLAHLVVASGGAFVATAGGEEVLRVGGTTGSIIARYPLSSSGGDSAEPSVVRRIIDAGDDGVYVLHESPSESMLTRIGWDDAMTTVAVDATGVLDVLAWTDGGGGNQIPTPVVGAADVGDGPGAMSIDPFVAPEDARPVTDLFVDLPTKGPVVGLALALWGPVAVTRDPFSIVSSVDGEVFTLLGDGP